MGQEEVGKRKPSNSSMLQLIEHAQSVQARQEQMQASLEKVLGPAQKAAALQKMINRTTAPLEALQRQSELFEKMTAPIKARQETIEKFLALYNRDKLPEIGIPQVNTGEDIAHSEDELFELKKFIPIELNPTSQTFIDKLLDNMGANSNFYNNAVLNLSHYYIFCLHCLLAKVYKHGERIELLGFLKSATGYFDKHDIGLDKLQHYAFNKIEREAIRFLFHLIGIDKNCHIYARNKRIFDLRNEIAHFNEQIIGFDKFKDIFQDVESNLKELFQQTSELTKESLIAEVNLYLKSEALDDENYVAVFEEINKRYYMTQLDYTMLANRLTEQKPKANYFILKYTAEQLGIELYNQDQ